MKKKEPDYSMSTILWILLALLVSKTFWLLTDISKYPPFSLLFSRYNFHYTKKEQEIAWSLVRQERFVNKVKLDLVHLSSDTNFVYLIIRTEAKQKKKVERMFLYLEEEVGKGNVYFNRLHAPYFQLNFVKDALRKDMLILS